MDIRERVEKFLDTIRPTLQSDNGDIKFVEIKDNKVYYRLSGACQGCPSLSWQTKYGKL